MNNNINIRVKTMSDETVSKLNKVSSSFSDLSSNVNKGSTSYAGFFKSNKKLNDMFSNMTRDMNRSKQSLAGLTTGFNNLNNVVKGLSIYKLATSMAQATQSNIDMVETINLFNVAMGEYAVQTNKAIEATSRFTGLDITNLQDRVGTFNLLARSMGLTNKNASVLSETTARLALDLSSLSNISITQVAQDLRSGLVGQSETMYKYGIDVTEASLKVEALNRGITKSVRNMSQGEKMALRYAVMIRQAGLSHGDFANNIETPANQLKILSERLVTLARSIGSLFIPMLSATLPYLNAFVIALTRIIDKLALLVGYKPLDNVRNISNGFSGIEDSAIDASDAVDKTGKAIKKLKGLMGFDELNILGSKDTGKKKKDEGTGSPFDIDLPTYDSLLGQVQQKSEELVDSIQEKLENILKLAGLIGSAILGWKLANALLSIGTFNGLLGETLLMIKKIGLMPTLAGFFPDVALAGVLTVMIARTADLILHSEKFRKGLVAIGDIAKSVFGGIKKFIDVVIDGFIKMGTNVWKALPDSWQKAITSMLQGMQKIVKALDLDFADLLITLAGIGLLFTPLAPFGVALLKFEAITVAIRALGYATSDVIDEFDMFAGISDTTRQKLEPFIQSMTELDNTIKEISWSQMTIDDAIVEDIRTKLSGIVDMITSELDADKNEALAKLQPLKNALGEKAYNELVIANQKYYDDMKKKVADGEQAIINIITEAQKNGGKLTEEHYNEINKIREEMNDLGIKHLTETEIEYNTIMNTLKDNSVRISLEQSRDIIKNAQETRDSAIQNAQEQYSTIELEAQRMLEVGAINEEQYNTIIESAKKAKDETVKDANEQYSNIEKVIKETMPEIAKYIDFNTGEIKTKWKFWTEELSKNISEKFNTMKTAINNWCDEVDRKVAQFRTSFSNGWNNFWRGIGNFFIDIWNGITGGLETGINWMIGGLNDLIDKYNDTAGSIPMIGKKITINSLSEISIGKIPPLARGGSLSDGQIFRAGEFGKAEVVGNFQGKTTVMPLENSGFTQAMQQAVLQGVITAMDGTDGGGVIVNIGDRTILDTLQSSTNRQSKINGKNVYNI